MSEGAESSVEKAEKTIEGIVYAFGANFTTLVALALPFFPSRQFFLRLRRLVERDLLSFRTLAALTTRQFFLRLRRLRERNLLAPPLLFLSISTFLFSIAVAIIDSDESNDVQSILSRFKARANLDISITQLVLTILPIFLWVLLVGLGARLLVADTHRRKQISRCFCYIFGLFGTGFFVWFLAHSLMQFDYFRHHNPPEHNLPVRFFVSLIFLIVIVVAYPFFLSVVAIWRLTRSEVILNRIFKSALGPLILATMIIGSIFIHGIPRRFNEAIAKPQPPKEAPITLANWPKPI